MILLETERKEYINLDNITVFEFDEIKRTIIIHEGPQKRVYTLTEASSLLLSDLLIEEAVL